jgi:hypothetical protein
VIERSPAITDDSVKYIGLRIATATLRAYWRDARPGLSLLDPRAPVPVTVRAAAVAFGVDLEEDLPPAAASGPSGLSSVDVKERSAGPYPLFAVWPVRVDTAWQALDAATARCGDGSRTAALGAARRLPPLSRVQMTSWPKDGHMREGRVLLRLVSLERCHRSP